MSVARRMHRLWLLVVAMPLLLAPLSMGAVDEPAVLQAVVGEAFILGRETTLRSPEYFWTLSADGNVIESQTTEYLRLIFSGPGTYDLSLLIRSSEGGQENISYTIHCGPKLSISADRSGDLSARLRSTPPAENDLIHLPKGGGDLRLTAEESKGNILFYGIDLHTGQDTSGDGIPDNDADNAYHQSFNSGEEWTVSLIPADDEKQRTIKLTVGDAEGNQSTTTLTVAFDTVMLLTPRLRTDPAPDPESGKIRLGSGGGIVRFNGADSFGGVSQYILDLDVTQDADGDGKPGNDNDFANTPFAQDGSDVIVDLQPYSTAERRIAFHVTDATGRIQTLERSIVFEGFSQGEEGVSPSIVSDPRIIRVGEQFTLNAENPPPGTASFGWDLRADGSVDQETNEPLLLLEPDAPGALPVKVVFRDADGMELSTLQKEFTVLLPGQEPLPPSSDGSTEPVPLTPTDELAIAASVKGFEASFEPKPGMPLNFLRLQPTWTFGDGSQSYLLHPIHTYAEAGTFTVTLVLTSIDDGTEQARAQATVTVTKVIAPDEKTPEGGSSLLPIIGRILFVILLVLIVLLLIGIPIFLVLLFLKKKRERLPEDMKIVEEVVAVPVVEKKKKSVAEGRTVEAPIALSRTEPSPSVDMKDTAGPLPPWLSGGVTAPVTPLKESQTPSSPETSFDTGASQQFSVGEDTSPSQNDIPLEQAPPPVSAPTPSWLQEATPPVAPSVPPPMEQEEKMPDWLKRGIQTSNGSVSSPQETSPSWSGESPPSSSPKPGDSVPDAGLDPSLIFSPSPEPPPSSPSSFSVPPEPPKSEPVVMTQAAPASAPIVPKVVPPSPAQATAPLPSWLQAGLQAASPAPQITKAPPPVAEPPIVPQTVPQDLPAPAVVTSQPVVPSLVVQDSPVANVVLQPVAPADTPPAGSPQVQESEKKSELSPEERERRRLKRQRYRKNKRARDKTEKQGATPGAPSPSDDAEGEGGPDDDGSPEQEEEAETDEPIAIVRAEGFEVKPGEANGGNAINPPATTTS